MLCPAHLEALPGTPVLTHETVGVWQLALDLPPERIAHLRRLLTPDEIERANRFRIERVAARFIVSRAALRLLLGALLETPPAALRFAYGGEGKPYLPDTDLCFNLSHSHEQMLIAAAWQRDVGIDIEHIHPISQPERLAERFFAPDEYTAYLALPPEQRERGFFNCWTRKEAFVKARGDSLTRLLARFAVALAPGDMPRVLHIDGESAPAALWTLIDLPLGEFYAAALALAPAPNAAASQPAVVLQPCTL